VLPSLRPGRADCAACDTGGKDELVFVRIVRPRAHRARLAVAAGFQLGARPAALVPCQRNLFSALAQVAFAGALEQVAQAGCQAFICGGGLFADPLPSLEHVRAAMAPLSEARRAGITIVAAGEAHGQATDGTSFLAEVGLIDAVLDARGPASLLISAANLQIALVTGGARGDLEAADLVLAFEVPGRDAANSAAMSDAADLVIDTCTHTASLERTEEIPIVETGRAGPSLDRNAQPGFVVLDIDPRNGVVPSLVATEALRPVHIVIESPQTGNEVGRLIGPELGIAGILDVEIRGRVSRSLWHDIDPAALVQHAATAGTLLRFAIDHLVVDESEHEATSSERPSFLVNARRESERLLAAAADETERDLVAAARTRVVEIARRREPTKAVT